MKLSYYNLLRDNSAYVYEDEFNAYCDNVECNLAGLQMTNSLNFDAGKMMPGGVKEGWIIYTVPQGKEIVIGFEPGVFTKNCFVSVGNS